MKQIYDNKDIGETIDKSFDAGIKEGYHRCIEQMMEKAVEGEVRKDGTIGYFEFSNEQQFQSLLEQFQDCDKVRIIICKKED